ncbi:hydrophobin [Serendipita vermifera]|nr:hydrophobin [Serendipita vermifera]
MFSKVALLSTITFAALFAGVSANPVPTDTCTVGAPQCCKSVYKSDDKTVAGLAALLGVLIPIDDLLVGLQCNPIVDIAGGNCSGTSVCCNNVQAGGLINLGCTNIVL